MKKRNWFLSAILCCLALSGCGGGSASPTSGSSGGSSGGNTGSSNTNLSVSVSGLSSGQSVTLQAQSTNTVSLTVTANGTFYFPQNINDANSSSVGGTNAINVSVSSQPSTEQCVVEPPATGIVLNSTVPVACSVPSKAPPYSVMSSFPGGSAFVITNPKVLPVFLTGAASENTDLVFLQQLVVSQYWGALNEYGVHNGTVESALYESVPSTLSTGSVDDSQIKSALESSMPSWGATLDSSTVVVVFLPSGTSYSPDVAQGEPVNAFADHGQITVNGTPVQFVAIPGQVNRPYYIAEYLVDAVTNPGGGGTNMSLSRGYVEAANDPERYDLTAYLSSNDPGVNRPYQEYIELGDACFGIAPSESDITLPNGSEGLNEIWSNSGAANAYSSGNYGYCQPSYGEAVDYSSSSDKASISSVRFGHTFTDTALVIPAGSSTTVTISAWGTDAYSGVSRPWSLTVNPEVFYTTGTAAPEDCSSGTPDYYPGYVPSECANAPSVSVSPNGSGSVTTGTTFKVTITMPSTAEPGLWSILLSGTDGGTEQPLLVTNASTWQ